MVALLGLAGCAAGSAQFLPSTEGEGPQRVSQLAPPPPASVPPNASRISASVRERSVWPPGSLRHATPPVLSDQTLYSLIIEIHTSDREDSALDSLARPGMVIEAFSSGVLASDLVGKKIQATLKLTGDTRGVRWRISNIRVLSVGRISSG